MENERRPLPVRRGNNFAAHHSASGQWLARHCHWGKLFCLQLSKEGQRASASGLCPKRSRRECSQKRELQRHSHYQSQRQRGEKKQELIDTQAREDGAVTTHASIFASERPRIEISIFSTAVEVSKRQGNFDCECLSLYTAD